MRQLQRHLYVLPVVLASLGCFNVTSCLVHTSDEALACAESRGGDVRILSLTPEQKSVELSITLHKVHTHMRTTHCRSKDSTAE